jgi:hypothetical protein
LAVCVRTPSRSNRHVVMPSGSLSMESFFPVGPHSRPA